MRNSQIILIVVAIVFAGLAFSNMKPSMMPYVSIAEARLGGQVQVAGKPVPETFHKRANEFTFRIRDDGGDMLTVSVAGLAPPGLNEKTAQVVAVGEYRRGVFHAEKILTKCPSKYSKKAKDETSRPGVGKR